MPKLQEPILSSVRFCLFDAGEYEGTFMSANDTNEDDNDKTVEASHYSVEIKIIVEFNHCRSYQCRDSPS